MCTASCRAQALFALGTFLFFGAGARAEQSSAERVSADRVSLWAGGGIGTFFIGGDGAQYVNGHKMGMLAVTLPGDNIRLRLLKGSLERTRAIPTNTGDNDVDYEGLDLVVTRNATGLPVDLAIGAARFEEAYHVGYPDQDLGGSVFVHRWGPHVSALRSWRFGRFFVAWAEADLHYAPYQPRQIIALLDIGLGARF